MPNVHSTLTSLFSDIADAIRAKTGESGTIVADEFPDAIAAIPSGGTLDLGYLTFTGTAAFTLKTKNAAKNWPGRLEYSTDAENWTEWDGSLISSVNNKLYLRGMNNTYITGSAGSDKRFEIGGDFVNQSVSCSGNIMDLLDCRIVALGDVPLMDWSCFRGLFDSCAMLASGPTLPATRLSPNCYRGMFAGSGLTTAPELPATTLAEYCYASMFYSCSKLASAPALPATTLAQYCYHYMFYQCTALTTAPALPATTLVQYCYQYMFYKCSALTSAPALPATTLATYCYDNMFSYCTELVSIPALPATTLALCCYQYMFRYCSKVKISDTEDSTYKYAYRIPTSGTGTTASSATYYMFNSTGGSFTGTPSVNTTYYTDHEPVEAEAAA